MRHQARCYTIRIQGHLDPRWSDWFEGLEITHLPDGHSTLHGVLVDQAALFGLLIKLRDLGLALVAVDSQEANGVTNEP